MDETIDSPSELTEFPRLSPEDKSSFGLSGLSKFFSFGRGTESTKKDDSTESTSSNSDNWQNDGDKVSASLPSEGRTLPNVLKRISNLVAQNNLGLTPYKNTYLKQYWMPDSFSNECYDCEEKFTTFRRRHHCRVCGQIFCSRCCYQEIPGKIMGCTGDLRVCTYCCKVVLSYLESADMTADLSSDLRALQEDLQVKLARSGIRGLESQQSSGTSSFQEDVSVKRKTSVGYQEERFALGKAPSCAVLSEEERCRALQNSASLRALFEEISREITGISLQTYRHRLRNITGCFSGSDLVEWLIDHSKAATRVQALAIGQMLLEAGYLESINELSFTDGTAMYRLVVELQNRNMKNSMNNPLGGVNSESEGDDEGSISHSGSSYLLDMNVEERVVHVVRPSPLPASQEEVVRRKKASVAHELDADSSVFLDAPPEPDNKDVILKSGWHRASGLVRSLFDEAEAYRRLSNAYESHRATLLSQLLSNVAISQAWSDTVTPLVESIVDKVRPDVRQRDAMDIRQYVQIKKLPSGNREECRIVPGVVCSKNVVHRGMRSHISDPRILILRCAVVYQRVEGRLLSLEPVMMQEHEYLRHVVARIAFLRPDVVLVYRNVSRLAQEYLLRLGITLVLNLKERTLDRVARFTGADVVTSIDAQISKPQLGTCKTFYISTFATENGGTKTLMFFEGSRTPEVSCTMLIRGGSSLELAKLKKIVSFLVSMEYNWRLEKSFLMDQFTMPPSPPAELFSDSPITSPREIIAPPKIEKTVVERQTVSDESDPLQAVWTPVDEPASVVVAIPRCNKFRDALDGTILCMSPYLRVSIPYLETDHGRNCQLRCHFPERIYYSKQLLERKEEKESKVQASIQPVEFSTSFLPPHQFLTAKFTEDAASDSIQTLLALFRANGGQIPVGAKAETMAAQTKVIPTQRLDVFDPYEHQRFAVLFCSYSAHSENAPAFCVDPWVEKIHFYGPDDIPLGFFLEKFCFRLSLSCFSQTCHVPMHQHVRRFVHDPGAICLTLNKLPKHLEPNQIWMWNWCTICKEASPMVPLSHDTWNLSFAKYLELRFRGESYTRRAAATCRHNLHHEHYQYFARDNLLASFKFSLIRIRWEISLPPRLIAIVAPGNAHTSAVDELRMVSIKGHDIYSIVLQQLLNLECSEEAIQNLKLQQQKEQAVFKSRIEEIQFRLTSPTLENKLFDPAIAEQESVGLLWNVDDSILALKRHICEAVATWSNCLLDNKRKEDRGKRSSDGNLKVQISPPQSEDGRCKDEDDENSICDMDEAPGWYKSCESLDVPESEDNLSVTSQQDEVRSMTDSTKDKKLFADKVDEAPADSKADKKSVKNILSQILTSTKDSAPLQYPWGPQEHYLLPLSSNGRVSAVIESEPSSIISYALSSQDYQKHLEEGRNITNLSDQYSPSALHRRKTPSVSVSDKEDPTSSSSHLEINFADNSASFSCRIYFAEDFANLRSLVFPAGEESYVRSLSHCVQWAARGGKSGSSFSKTKDDRFVLKQMSKLELHLFLELALQYVSYVSKCHEQQTPTLLGKIVGVYTVCCRSSSGSVQKSTLLVMENLFYRREVTQKYDLKGSVRNRLVNPDGGGDPDIVYLDENLLKMTCDAPLYILPHSQKVLMRAIESDTEFLASQKVMDYSLLVGLDQDSSELVVGIIDYIRTFTWDKKLENMVKKSVILGHPGKQPTIIQPKEYRARFIAAMKRYFLPVPDRWFDFEETSFS